MENKRKYTQNATEIDEDLTEHGPPQQAWDQVAPGAAEQQEQSEAEGSEEMRTIEQEDGCQCSNFPTAADNSFRFNV